MARLGLALALLLAAVPASAQSRPTLGLAPYAAVLAGSALDLHTTLAALSSGLGQEGNPLLSHGGTPGLVAVKSASTVGMLLMVRLVGKTHPKAARVLGYAVGAGLSGLALHNARVGR